MKISIPETIDEAINDIEEFFQCDMWHCIEDKEWKKEEDMIKYLDAHFNILRKDIKRILRRKK